MSNSVPFSSWNGETPMDVWYNAAVDESQTSAPVPRGREPCKISPYFEDDKYREIDHGSESDLEANIPPSVIKYPTIDINDWYCGMSDEYYSQNSPLVSCPSPEIAALSAQTSITDTDISSAKSAVFRISSFGTNRSDIERPAPLKPTNLPYFDYIFADAGIEDIHFTGGEVDSDYSADTTPPANYYPQGHLIGSDLISSAIGISSPPRPETPPEIQLRPTPKLQLQFPLVLQTTDPLGYAVTGEISPFQSKHTPILPNNSVPSTVVSISAPEEAYDGETTANFGFYGGFTVEESPDRFHAPVVDQTSGYGDIREGLEEFPEQWAFNEERSKSYNVSGVDAVMRDITDGAGECITKVILMPRSQRARVKRLQQDRFKWTTSQEINHLATRVFKTSKASVCEEPCEHLQLKKRNARNSLIIKPSHGMDINDEDEARYFCTKKARIAPQDQQDTPICSPVASIFSLLSKFYGDEPEHEYESSITTGRLFSGVRLVPPAVVGYSGQFRNREIEAKLFEMDLPKSPLVERSHMTTGDCLHPNYLFTHLNFFACEDTDRIENTNDTGNKVTSILDVAYNMSVASAEVYRTNAQENLRREIHLECTAARLEGVSVGQYRYYQGHLNIEEYKEANICICWDVCICSKMCTRFGDLMCPCSKHIEMIEF